MATLREQIESVLQVHLEQGTQLVELARQQAVTDERLAAHFAIHDKLLRCVQHENALADQDGRLREVEQKASLFRGGVAVLVFVAGGVGWLISLAVGWMKGHGR